ncbi:hypothetical protein MNVM_12590 [Mycobacterium novum]|uniref:Uncharacterized protein n=1 Tax=Mycobacterium novum TaxID=2492438 RepID=A0A7I7JL96_9MYCO|nr:hypothetical protein MNVM_12590 [Mycobacterium novum]
MSEPPRRPSAIQDSIHAAMDDVIATGLAEELDEPYTTTNKNRLPAKSGGEVVGDRQ